MATYSNISALEAATSSISANFLDLDRSESPATASSGAVGLNINAYANVSFQRQAVWTAMLALEEGSASDLAPAIAAMQYGFQQEQADGSFYNADAVDGWTNYESDAFFLQSFVQIYLGVKNSPLWSTYKTQLSALVPKLSTAMNWLATQASALSTANSKSANRLFLDGIAFELGGQILNDDSLVQTGVNFANQGSALQSPNGYYMENGGWDSSYNGTSMLAVETLLTYSTNSAQVAQLKASLASAASWEESRILASGQVLTTGNTRTAGQENGPSGSIKTINYGEVAASLALCWDDPRFLGRNKRRRRGRGLRTCSSGRRRSCLSAPASFTIITANGAGVATGDGGSDELMATGPNQTLTANGMGGQDVFYVGGYSGVKVVNHGTSLTEVVTSLANYTLPAGVDDLT